jgi:hypothetical protein
MTLTTNMHRVAGLFPTEQRGRVAMPYFPTPDESKSDDRGRSDQREKA